MRTKNVKRILTGLFLITSLSIGSLLGIALMVPSLIQAEDDADFWQNEWYNLSADYQYLLFNYTSLFYDYEVLREAFEEPLTSPIIPTISEFQTWLYYYDDTNEHNYTSDWMCGDFSAMLMTRAKTMNWRVRIAVMEFSFLGDPNYNINTPFGKYGHAFNFIECSDGYIYYIEPQSDSIWYWSVVGYHFVMWSEYDFTTISGTVWDGQILSVNYYNYFG